jgi:hypothetical protein
VYRWNRVRKPRIVPRSTGRKSKKRVRSVSVASEMSLPRVDGLTFS